MNTLQQQFNEKLAKELQTKLSIKNTMALPKLSKIVINMGVKDAVADKKLIEKMNGVMVKIIGQKPRITRAKKSIASFKLREGDAIGLMVTLRGKRMYEFFEKITNVVLPRIRDFRGVKRTSFDGHGNYALGFREYSLFPEVDPGSVDRVQGFEIIITTTAKNDEEGLALLEVLGMPFTKGDDK